MYPFSFNIESDLSMIPLDLVPTLVAMARSDKPEDVFQGVMLIRKLLVVESNPPIQEVVDSGVAEVLAKCMTDENADLQFEASWALSNIVSGDTSHAHYIIELGVVPLWIGHLSSGNYKCQEQAVWALGNVAGEGSKCRNYVLKEGAMQPLLDLICSCVDNNPSLLTIAVWALSNLCRFKPPPPMECIIPAVPVLTKMLQHPNPEVSVDSMWALSYIADQPEGAQLVIDSGVVPAVVQRLSSGNIKYHLPAIRIIGNICAGNVKQCQVAINAGCLPSMKSLLDKMNAREVRKEAARALSNIAAGNQNHIQAMIDAGLLSNLEPTMLTKSIISSIVGSQGQIKAMIDAGLLPAIVSAVGGIECEVKEEALQACANIATNGSCGQINNLVECGVLEALCEVLRSTGDVAIVTSTLEAMHVVLESGIEHVQLGHCMTNPYPERVQNSLGGILAIEHLMSHSNSGINDLAEDIMSCFFNKLRHRNKTAAQNTTQPVVDDEQPPPMQRPKEDNHATVEGEDDNGKGF